MQKNNLGNTNLRVSALGLGTVALGMAYGIAPQGEQGSGGMTPPSLREATHLIQQAIDGGLTFIDTARGYGRSEEVLGHALQGRRDAVVLASKLSTRDSEGNDLHGAQLRQQMESSLHESLRLLQTDHIDLLMLHTTPPDYNDPNPRRRRLGKHLIVHALIEDVVGDLQRIDPRSDGAQRVLRAIG